MSSPTDRLNQALEGRYRLERELGKGGMATVYLAQDVRHDREVAIKVLKPELAAVVGGDRFLAEIKTTATLHHPHILPLFDSGEADGFLFFVMPYVEDETLRERFKRHGQLPVDEAVDIARKVAGALQHAHDRGVLHRDIKPANILMQDGEPVVADFGIALAMSAAGGDRLTETGLSVGTPFYMSPEQATGDQEVGPPSDIYALACVLYEMLVGEPPFTGNTAQSVLGKIIAGEATPPRTRRASIPAHVDAVLRRGLEKIPADRFASATEFAAALTNPAFRHGDAAASEGGRGAPRWIAAAGWILALGLGAGWALSGGADPEPVSMYGVVLPLDQPLDISEPRPRVSVSPDGSALVYVGVAEGREPELFVKRRDQLTARPIVGTETAVSPFFSPDGTHVGFVRDREPQQLITAPLGGGPVTVLADTLVGADGGSWGDDGFIYYDGITGAGTTGLVRVAATGGATEQVTTIDRSQGETDHVWPHALPDARGVLFTIVRGDELDAADVAVFDAETGEHRVLIRGVRGAYAESGHLVFVTAEGTLMAAAFDLGRLELSGVPVVFEEGVSTRINGAVDLAVSRSGTLVYGTGAAMAQPKALAWLDRDGNLEPVDPAWAADFRTVAVSPDGSKLVASAAEGGSPQLQQLFVKRLPDGAVSRLTFEGFLNVNPAWTPDGESVGFLSDRDGGIDLYLRRADGSQPARPLRVDDATYDELSFSADGEWLIYGAGGDLYAQPRTDGAEPLTLVATRFTESAHALSPDGRYLAYTSDESGRSGVYVVPFPDAGQARWTISTDDAGAPKWSPDGSELFFLTPGAIMSVVVSSGDAFRADPPRSLVALPGRLLRGGNRWDVAPDERFLFMRNRSSGAGSGLVLVENVFEELRRRTER